MAAEAGLEQMRQNGDWDLRCRRALTAGLGATFLRPRQVPNRPHIHHEAERSITYNVMAVISAAATDFPANRYKRPASRFAARRAFARPALPFPERHLELQHMFGPRSPAATTAAVSNLLVAGSSLPAADRCRRHRRRGRSRNRRQTRRRRPAAPHAMSPDPRVASVRRAHIPKWRAE